MSLRTPALAVLAGLLALPAAAQTLETEPEPFFIGRVDNAPMPTRKAAPPPEVSDADTTVGAPDDAAVDAPAEPDGTGDTTTAAAGGGRVRLMAPTATDSSDTTTTGGGSGIETRPLPVLVRSEDPTDPDLDAGGRIKPVPEPGADGEVRKDDRFVRAPKGKWFEPDAKGALGAPLPTPDTELLTGATLRQLDKMTGRITTFDIAVGQTLQVARLAVKLDACRAPGDNDTHGTIAHLKIWDTKHDETGPAFAGWMFAESPALSALDHPRYDLWVINCTTVSGETSAASE